MPIRYRYAYTTNKEIAIDAIELDRQNLSGKEVFKCVGCDHVLIPVLGKKRQKHFRHKTEVDCSFETYLHKLAKNTFYRVYRDCLQQNKPYLITINQTKICNYYQQDYLVNCNFGIGNYTFDLTQYFSEIYLELRQDSFIPDLLLTNEYGDKLFVEIAVTHEVSNRKRESEFRIIELNIANEDDLKIVKNANLKENEKIKFFNFKTELVGNFCQGKCQGYSEYNYFVIFNSGKSIILEHNLEKINRLIENKKIKYIEPTKDRSSSKYIELVTKSYYDKRGIKNCFLCRYHAENDYSNEPIFCKFLKKSCGSNEAAICQYYREDERVFPDW